MALVTAISLQPGSASLTRAQAGSSAYSEALPRNKVAASGQVGSRFMEVPSCSGLRKRARLEIVRSIWLRMYCWLASTHGWWSQLASRPRASAAALNVGGAGCRVRRG